MGKHYPCTYLIQKIKFNLLFLLKLKLHDFYFYKLFITLDNIKIRELFLKIIIIKFVGN